MKTCSKCKTLKEDYEFAKRGPGLQPWCRVCNKERSRLYYAQHTTEHRAYVKVQKKALADRNRSWIYDYLTEHPCTDCGEKDHIVLEFDHLRDKANLISVLACSGVSITHIQNEIAKCDVVCANCHRRRTSARAGHYKHKRKELSSSL